MMRYFINTMFYQKFKPAVRGLPPLAIALAMMALAPGCALQEKPSGKSVFTPDVSVSPIADGGIVGVSATGMVAGNGTRAASSLLDWRRLAAAQSDTLSVHGLTPDHPVPVLTQAQFQATGCTQEQVATARSTWLTPSSTKPREIMALLKAMNEAGLMPAALCAPPDGTAPAPVLTATRFKTSRGPLLVLADIRIQKTDASSRLAEYHFFVSRGYQAGVNIYSIEPGRDGCFKLTIQVFCWVSQAEGFLGAIPRKLAGNGIRRQAGKLWTELAGWLGDGDAH